jgi:6-phosphogluconolactonase
VSVGRHEATRIHGVWSQLGKLKVDEWTMKATIAFLLFMFFGTSALAATFVYVSNADDGQIGTYTLQQDGSLKPGQRIKAEKIVMPMALSADKRFLIAVVRSKPYQAYSYNIHPGSGELKLVGTGSLVESFPYISLDRRGRFLFGASYGGNLISVNPVGADGRIGEPGCANRAQCALDPDR